MDGIRSSRLRWLDAQSRAGGRPEVADALGIHRFAVMGHSGGTTHALACSALRRNGVTAALCVASLAPFDAQALDWFAGMAPSITRPENWLG